MKLEEHDSKYKLFVERVSEALTALGADKEPVKAAAIYAYVDKNSPEDLKLLAPSWGSHLSHATHDDGTRIRRVPDRYTYRLLSVAPKSQEQPAPLPVAPPQADETQTAPAVEPAAVYTKREATLYQPLRDWLSGRGFRAEDRSRSKSGGIWGNPDVTGIRVSEGYMGSKSIEVATIEAKTSMTGWRQYIFEAVSHKRFAHRSYFAFAFGADEPSVSLLPEVDSLRYYAERFRVGVLVVFFPDAAFQKLRDDKGEIAVDAGDARVEELWPAIYEDVRLEESTAYLWRVLNIDSDESLYKFGSE